MFRPIATACGICVALLLGASTAHAQGLPLRERAVQATVTLELDASKGAFGDTVSIAPDLAVGVSEELTLALVHSTFGRTGFRGAAGSGICVTDACAHVYDNAGVEALYSLRTGDLAVAANAGVHALSFDSAFYVAKLGAKLRYVNGKLTFASLPSVFVAMTSRDAVPENRDRIWLPVSAMYAVGGGVALGVGTGFKAPLDDLDDSFEIAAGLLVQYAVSPSIGLGASWVHGKLGGGDAVLPPGTSGFDTRTVQVWMTATR